MIHLDQTALHHLTDNDNLDISHPLEIDQDPEEDFKSSQLSNAGESRLLQQFKEFNIEETMNEIKMGEAYDL